MSRFRKRTLPILTYALAIFLLASLFLLSQAAQQSDRFANYYSILLVLDVVGIILVLIVVIANIVHLLQELRSETVGAGLTLRLIVAFLALSVLPLSVVYYVSVEFLNRGIDSWFDVRIEQALNDALLLGRTSLEAARQDMEADLATVSSVIQSSADPRSFSQIANLREQYGFQELTLFASSGHVLASSSESQSLIPEIPAKSAFSRSSGNEPSATLEPAEDGSLILKGQTKVTVGLAPRTIYTLFGIRNLPPRYAKLGESVQDALGEYKRLLYLRGPLKTSFVLTLTMVALSTLLVGIWAAIVLSQRLAAPLRELAKGTSALASGDYSQRLQARGSDEMGVLVRSFNDMTEQIQQAHQQVAHAHEETEAQKTYLETVLAYLSSGVIAIDNDMRLLKFNTRAAQILGLELSRYAGAPLSQISEKQAELLPFVNSIASVIETGQPEWSGEVELFGGHGRQTLLLRLTHMLDSSAEGWVIVFDDATELVQAQRNAAWSEVARRLAHEIKNPLTPIQLSAERLQRKYSRMLEAEDREVFERSTRTIIEQVGSMKTMVDAFSSYAKPARVQPVPVDINELLRDAVTLFRGHSDTQIVTVLEIQPVYVHADPNAMRQIFNNLLTNALAACAGQENPEIKLRSRIVKHLGNDYVEITCEDSGPGFNEDILDRVFEPYITTKEHGSGLGLAIVKKIVEEHGGFIQAKNAADSGGAVVRLLLPIHKGESE